MPRNIVVFGIYPTSQSAEEAIYHLRGARFRNSDVSVVLSQNQPLTVPADENGAGAPGTGVSNAEPGAESESVLGLLSGIGVPEIPGLRPVLATGPMVAELGGAGALGGIAGAMIRMDASGFAAKRYEWRIREGAILVSVHCTEQRRVERAKEILSETGAEDITVAGEIGDDIGDKDEPPPRVRAVGGDSVTADEPSDGPHVQKRTNFDDTQEMP
jgi:hypothetical protein